MFEPVFEKCCFLWYILSNKLQEIQNLYDLETYGLIGVLFLHMLQVLTNINKS